MDSTGPRESTEELELEWEERERLDEERFNSDSEREMFSSDSVRSMFDRRSSVKISPEDLSAFSTRPRLCSSARRRRVREERWVVEGTLDGKEERAGSSMAAMCAAGVWMSGLW